MTVFATDLKNLADIRHNMRHNMRNNMRHSMRHNMRHNMSISRFLHATMLHFENSNDQHKSSHRSAHRARSDLGLSNDLLVRRRTIEWWRKKSISSRSVFLGGSEICSRFVTFATHGVTGGDVGKTGTLVSGALVGAAPARFVHVTTGGSRVTKREQISLHPKKVRPARNFTGSAPFDSSPSN